MADQTKLVILHTNDLHSRFEQMPKIASMLNRIRREKDGTAHVLAVDCGDHMDRAFIETEATRGWANVAVMNRMKLDAALPGNNEGLTFTLSELGAVYQKAELPVICANLLDSMKGTPPDWMHPYQLLQAGRLTVAIIGVTAAFADFYQQLGWDALDPIETVSRIVPIVRGAADVVILLSHLGLSQDRQLVQKVPGIDILLGGHTHHLLETPLLENGTLICGAGKFGTHVGRVELVYDHDKRKICQLSGGCLLVDNEEGDPELASALAKCRIESERRLSVPVTTLREDMPAQLAEETRLGDLLANAIRRATGTDVALVNAGQLVEGLSKGTVTEGMLHRICPSSIHACVTHLTGTDLLQALEESLLPENTTRNIYGYGFRGTALGMLNVSNMTIHYDAEAPSYRKIFRVDLNGEPLVHDRIYRVGTIGMFLFGLGYPTLANGTETRHQLPLFLRDLLAAELKRYTEGSEDVWQKCWIPV
nr:bifunctional UDP-sugar hydrolase/5'-nucleotidase [Gorillibacterium timonense]